MRTADDLELVKLETKDAARVFLSNTQTLGQHATHRQLLVDKQHVIDNWQELSQAPVTLLR